MMPNQSSMDMNQYMMKQKPRRSFTALEKLAILSEVSQTGFNATQRKYKIQGTQITKWRKRIEELKKLTEKSSRASRVVSKQIDSKYPEIENCVYRQYLETMNQTGKVNNSQIQNWAKELARSQDMKNFYGEELKLARFGQVWLNSFKKRFNINTTSSSSSMMPLHVNHVITNPQGLSSSPGNSIVIGAMGSTGVTNVPNNVSSNISNSLSGVNLVNNVNGVVSIGQLWPGAMHSHLSLGPPLVNHIRGMSMNMSNGQSVLSNNMPVNNSLGLMDLRMPTGVVIDGSMSGYVNMRSSNESVVSNLEYLTDSSNSSDDGAPAQFIDR